MRKSTSSVHQKPSPFQTLTPLRQTQFDVVTLDKYKHTFWNMNMLQVYGSWLFIGLQKEIHCYKLDYKSSTCLVDPKKPQKVLSVENDIHQIRVGILASEPVLMAVGNNGLVNLYYVNDLDKQPIELSNGHESTWSLDVHEHFVAVGANSWQITVWDMSKQNYSFFIRGHRHNIPCIAFSPCGTFIASVSIDCTVRVWDLLEKSEEKMILKKKPGSEWGWAVRWVPTNSIKVVHSSDPVWQTPEDNYAFLLENIDDEHESVDELITDDDDPDDTDEEGSGEESSEEEEPTMLQLIEREEEATESRSQRQQQTSSQQEVPPKSKRLPTDFLLCTSKHHIYLLNSNLQILDKLFYNPYSVALPSWFKGLSRLSLVEYIPELSLALIASQSDSKIAMIRIIQSEETKDKKYKLVPEAVIPDGNLELYTPLAGFGIQKLESDNRFHARYLVFLLTADKQLAIFEISRNNGGKLDISRMIM